MKIRASLNVEFDRKQQQIKEVNEFFFNVLQRKELFRHRLKKRS